MTLDENPLETLEEQKKQSVVDQIRIRNLIELNEAQSKDLNELKSIVQSKNAQVIRLEAENLRLKMLRTDKELATQVDGLRHEVGRKDREIVDLRRRIEVMTANEKTTLLRASMADQKIVTLQNTMVTFQKSRDAAHLEVEKHDRERLDAVREMITATDRAKKAEESIKTLPPLLAAVERALASLPSSVKGLKDVQALSALVKKKEEKK